MHVHRFVFLHVVSQVLLVFGLTYPCPNCKLDSPTKYGCVDTGVGAQTNVYVCAECPPGFKACEVDSYESPGCLDMASSNRHCGDCSRNCTGDTPSCVGGSCGCSSTESDLCGTGFWCNSAAKRCTACPAGKANCDPNSDSSTTIADCETNISTDTANCGSCGYSCGEGETCSNGRCVCGSGNQRCTFPQICDGSQCVDCPGPVGDSLCHKLNPFDFSGFCNPSTKKCNECPTGFADCTDFASGGGMDTGTTADCETSITTNNNCGACGVTCGQHGAQSCCSGACKCGKFSNHNAPSQSECSAAVECTSTEYCDEQLEACVPLFPDNEVCSRNAILPDQDWAGAFGNKETCGNCNRTLGLANIVDNKCTAFNSSFCGSNGEVCRDGQTCFKGRCACTLPSSVFFDWSPAIERDPDNDNKIDALGIPLPGCDMNLILPVTKMLTERVFQGVYRFARCAVAAAIPGVDRFTVDQFSDPGFRSLVCPGGPNHCPTVFCDEIFTNLTQIEKGRFCSALETAAAQMKSCAIGYKLNTQTVGDLTCANVLYRDFASIQPDTFGSIDAFNFLGCRTPYPNFTIRLDGVQGSFMYRAETAKLLLGGSTIAQISWISMTMVFSAVLLIVCY